MPSKRAPRGARAPAGAGTWNARLPAAAVALVVCVVFARSLGNGWTGWDDGAYITDSPLMTERGGLLRIWASREPAQYYPLTLTTFWIEYRLWGERPLGYHAVNVALHAVNATLVLLFARALRLSRRAAVVVALLFAVHPMQVMSVAWVAERNNLLSALFCLLAYPAWLRSRRSHRSGWYLASLIAFVAACLSKTAVLTLPLALAALDTLVLRAPLRSTALRTAPLFALAFSFAALTALYEQTYIANPPPVASRPLLAATCLWFYVGKLLWPAELLPVYPKWAVWVADWRWWPPLLGLLAVAVLILRFRRRLGGVVLFGLAHFIALLLPVLGLVAYGNLELTYVSDHYVYFAVAGLLVALGFGLDALRMRSRGWGVALVAVAAGAIVALAVLTLRYIPTFQDGRALWSRTLAGNPTCFAAHAGLGEHHLAGREWRDAARHFTRALEIHPDTRNALLGLGRAQAELGEIADAQRTYERAAAVYPRDAAIRLSAGRLHLAAGNRAQAAAHFHTAIELDVHQPLAYLGLATCQRADGDGASAVQTLRAGLAAAPGNVPLMNLLARILATDPDDGVRDGAQAVQFAEQTAAATKHQDILVLDTLAAAYAEAGRFDYAVATAQQAAELARARGFLKTAAAVAACREQYRGGRPLRETRTNLVLE